MFWAWMFWIAAAIGFVIQCVTIELDYRHGRK